MKMLSKGIWQAINQKLPLYWTGIPDSWSLELRAVTATNENSTVRSRRLTTCDRPVDIMDLSKDIKRAGGLIDLKAVTTLLESVDEERSRIERELHI